MTHNPHDRLFKAVFSDPENAAAHFATCLPPALVAALDLARARQLPGSWVDEAFRGHHSDVAHASPFRGVATDGDATGPTSEPLLLYAIWEHQSTVDPLMAWRAHRYTMRLLESWSREHPDAPHLPPVLVLVLYHGDEPWTAPEDLEDLFALDRLDPAAQQALRPYLPKQRYLLEVLPEDPTAIRASPGIVRMTMVALKLGRSAEVHGLIVELMPDLQTEQQKGPHGLHHIGVFVQYLLMVNPEASPEKLAEELEPMGTEVHEIPKTWGQRMVEKSWENGLEKGRDEGRREKQVAIARKLLAKSMPPAEVAETTDVNSADHWSH